MKILKKINGVLAGELILKKLWHNEWEIEYLTVQENYRGKGIATELLKKAKSHAVKKGLVLIGFIEPTGTLDHEQMKSWLKRHGFTHGWYDFTNSFTHGHSKRVMIFNER